MSRLDRHVAMVQNKLALGRFVQALAWSAVIYASAVWVAVVVDRVAHVRPPHVAWFLWGGVAACGLAALIWAVVRRPTAHEWTPCGRGPTEGQPPRRSVGGDARTVARPSAGG